MPEAEHNNDESPVVPEIPPTPLDPEVQQAEDDRLADYEREQAQLAAERAEIEKQAAAEEERIAKLREEERLVEPLTHDEVEFDIPEPEHNDGNRDGEFGPIQKGHAQPVPLDDVLKEEADPQAFERGQ